MIVDETFLNWVDTLYSWAFLNVCFILFFSISKLHYITLYTESDYPFGIFKLFLHYITIYHIYLLIVIKKRTKTWISNLVHTTRFWNMHTVKRLESQIISLGERNPMCLKGIAKNMSKSPLSGREEP
jgi:hypothetical protein